MTLPTNIDAEGDLGVPKADYAPTADPTKEISAAEYNRMAISLSMVTYTAPRAWVVVSAAASAGTMVRTHSAMWGDTTAVKPTVTATSTGVFAITWPASVQDLHPVASSQSTTATNLRMTMPSLRAVGQIFATCAANVATVTTTLTGGTAASLDFNLAVY